MAPLDKVHAYAYMPISFPIPCVMSWDLQTLLLCKQAFTAVRSIIRGNYFQIFWICQWMLVDAAKGNKTYSQREDKASGVGWSCLACLLLFAFRNVWRGCQPESRRNDECFLRELWLLGRKEKQRFDSDYCQPTFFLFLAHANLWCRPTRILLDVQSRGLC